jgi:hypothetical protein
VNLPLGCSDQSWTFIGSLRAARPRGLRPADRFGHAYEKESFAMKRFVSKLKFALPIVALLAGTAIVSAPAKAWEQGWQSSDGSVSLWYERGSDGQTKFAVIIEKNGKFGVYFEQGVIDAVFDKMGGSNPDPNDPNNGQGTFKPDVEELLKKAKGATVIVAREIWETPLGDYLERGGGGKGPKWNPGPDDDGEPGGSGGKPDKPEGPTAKEVAAKLAALNAAIRGFENMKGGMYDGSEGGTESPPTVGKGPHSNHGQGNNGDDGDDGPKKPVIDTNELGPKPELVNPPYFKTPGKAKTAKTGIETKKPKVATIGTKGKADGKGKTDGKSAGGSILMSPGLLGGGTGLGANGPSSAGMAPGAGGMGGAPLTSPVSRLR